MSKQIVMEGKTSTGFESVYPFSPSNLLYATTEGSSVNSNYDLTIANLETPFDEKMGIILFIPTVTNVANATITLNSQTPYNIKYQNGTNVGDGVIVINTPVLIKYYNNTFYLLTSKEQIGLINVDNTSDANKEISIPQQNALDNKLNKSATIPEDSDLNTYTTEGMYKYASTATGLSNIPTAASAKMFSLFVEQNGNGVVQTLNIGQTTGIQRFSRISYGGTWGDWMQLACVIYGTTAAAPATYPDGTLYVKYTL